MKGIRKSVPSVRMVKNHLSLVIPCYRESERLPKFLESLLKTFKGTKSVDFLVVDDGSPIAEFEILKEKINHLLSNPQIQLLRYKNNLGKGGAIQFGLNVAKGNYFGFVDADGATPAEEVFRSWNHINNHPEIDLLAGSRIIMMGRNVKNLFTVTLPIEFFHSTLHLCFESKCMIRSVAAKYSKKLHINKPFTKFPTYVGYGIHNY